MRIVHVSDNHWNLEKYPVADLYVWTGDILRNYPVKKVMAYYSDWTIDPAIERIKQKLAVSKFVREAGGLQQYLGSPDAPIVAVRGNHDFIDIAPFFTGCNFVHEFVDNEVVSVNVAGELLSITGHRGVPTINGMWNDETPVPDLIDRQRRFPLDCDLYLTHYNPQGVLDEGHYGLPGMAMWMEFNLTKPHPIHLAGHCHKSHGSMKPGKVLFSNAATTWNLIVGDPISGWVDESPM